MSWLVIRTLLGGWLKRLFGLFTAYPLQCALIASLACNVWLWRGWSDEQAEHEADVAELTAASDMNHAAQVAQVKALEAKSAKLAKEADNAHSIAVADARSLTDRYADAHRCTVRQTSLGPAGPPSQGNDPGIPAQVPAAPEYVGIAVADLQTVADLYVYALTEHNRAMDKIAAGQAIPSDGR